MRGTVEGLHNPFPLVRRLPAVYQEDDLTQRFTGGLDEVLAPVLSTLDNLWAYFDPRLCPTDFLPWLAAWVGVELDPEMAEAGQRDVVRHAASWQRARGTAIGLVDQLQWLTGVSVDVTDTSTVTWSTTPVAPPTAAPAAPRVGVHVHAQQEDVDVDLLQSLVEGAIPAHVIATLEVRP